MATAMATMFNNAFNSWNVNASLSSASLPVGYQPTWLEAKWLGFFENAEYPALKLTLVLFIWHEFVFFGRFLPYYIMDHIPALRKYKIQPDKEFTPAMYWKCIKYVIWGQLFVQLPLMLGFHPLATLCGMKFVEVPFPSALNIVLSCAFCLVMEDAWHYWAHRLLHHGVFYKHIHKLHHEFSAPAGIAAEYAHPAEQIFTGIGFFVGPFILMMAGVKFHVVTMTAWLAVRLIETVDVHAGYEFPWSLHRFLPFFGGSDFHDYHHMAFVGNYSSTFRWWDWMCGTDAGYNKHKASVAKRTAVKKMD